MTDIRRSAVFALRVLAEARGIRFSTDEVAGQEADDAVGIEKLAGRVNIELSALDVSYSQLANLEPPFVVTLTDGTYRTVLTVSSRYAEVRRIDLPSSHVVTRGAFEEKWSGRAYVAAIPDRLGTEKSWGEGLVKYFGKYRASIVQAAIVSGFVYGLSLCTPIVVLLIIDKVISHNGLDTLDVLITGLVAVGVFEFVLSIVREGIVRHVSIQIDVELGSRLYGHVTSLPLSWFASTPAGDVAARFSDLGRIRDFLALHSVVAVLDVGFSVAFLVVLYVMQSELALIVAISLPIYALVAVFSGFVQRRRVAERERRSASNQARLVETLTGIESVKAMGLEGDFRERWNRELSEYGNAAERAHRTATWSGQSVDFVNRMTIAAILWFGTNAVTSGEMTLGQFIAFNLIAMRLSGPVLRVTRFWREFQQVRYAGERISGILQVEKERKGSIAPAGRAIEFRNVCFRYPGAVRDTLSDLDFRIPENGFVGLVGRSGSGKSTVLRLMQGLYLPDMGVLRIGGVDIGEVDHAEWRKKIGVVLQDEILFARTVAENIAVRDRSMSWEQVIRAAKVAGAHEFIVEMPRGYNTVVGERGCTLSGGQRQRLALARSVATEPELLLLDEPTSALDNESEVRFRECLASIAENRTVVVSTHRLGLLRDADRIVVVDAGRVVETGKHRALMARGGVYAGLAGQETIVQ